MKRTERRDVKTMKTMIVADLVPMPQNILGGAVAVGGYLFALCRENRQ